MHYCYETFYNVFYKSFGNSKLKYIPTFLSVQPTAKIAFEQQSGNFRELHHFQDNNIDKMPSPTGQDLQHRTLWHKDLNAALHHLRELGRNKEIYAQPSHQDIILADKVSANHI